MTEDELVALIILFAIGGAAFMYVAQKLFFWVLNRQHDVKGLAASPKPAPVVTSNQPPKGNDNKAPSPPSHKEGEGEEGPEAGPEEGPEKGLAIVQLTEKALQERDADNYERGMIDAYATLQRLGFTKGGKGDMQRALAAVAGQRSKLLPGLGGRKHQALALAIAEVPVPEPPPPPPQQTPVAGRDVPGGVKFIGENESSR